MVTVVPGTGVVRVSARAIGVVRSRFWHPIEKESQTKTAKSNEKYLNILLAEF
jgi:hypothetical protein